MKTKQKFKFFLDQKVTLWERTSFAIEAESQAQAEEIAKEVYTTLKDDGYYNEDRERVEKIDDYQMWDTQKSLTPEQNEGLATIELYRADESHHGAAEFLVIANGKREDEP